MTNRLLPITLAVWGWLFGCSSTSATAPNDGGAQAGAGGGTQSQVTFHRDLEPILQRSCQSCHVPDGLAPFPLLTVQHARTVAGLMVKETAARTMPPWHARNTDECTVALPWKHDTRLSDDEIALFQAWRDAGTPEGDPSEAPTPLEPATGLPGVQLALAPGEPYALDPGGDEFRCFVLDPKLTVDTFVNGVFVVPGNDSVVHHALVFIDPERQSLDNALGSDNYDCFGGARVANSELLTAWTPGGIPLEYPSNIAVPIAAGSLLVMQVHYHPHSATEVAQDRTTLQLRFSDQAPEYEAVTRLIGNFRSTLANGDGLEPGPADPASGAAFMIPANANAHTETMRWTFRALGTASAPRLYGVGGHMHYAGVDEKVTLTRSAGGSEECLMHIPRWDFDWQRRYDFDAPVAELPVLRTGDRLTVRCTYDNTMDNAAVARSLRDQGLSAPRDVQLGESTLDEMCLANLTALYPVK